MPENISATKILIVGNGFGGTYTLKKLRKIYSGEKAKKVKISLIGEKDYFLFTPLLHEVATGGVNPANIVEPIRKSLSGCLDHLYVGKVNSVNLKNKTLEIFENSGDGKNVVKEISYDFLVLAHGAKTNFYGIPEAEKYSFPLKSLEDARKIKNRAIAQMQDASLEPDREKRKKKLSFVVVGGGATGVELAAELYEFLKGTFSHHYPSEIIQDVSVTLIQRDSELLPQFGAKLRQKSLELLRKKGVEVLLGTGVTKVNEGDILLDNGKSIETENVIWVAGIKPADLKFNEEVPKLKDGRIIVNEYSQLPDYKNVSVIGDAAAIKIKKEDKYVPALAQATVEEATRTAKNIELLLNGKNPKEFIYHHKGNLVSLGYGMALGEVANFTFWGHITWWVWRTVYLSKIISWKKKVKIAIEWTINLFQPRDISPL